MRYDIKTAENRFEALIGNFCRDIIKERAGGLIYNFEDEWVEQVFALTDSIVENMNSIINDYMEKNIPCWKSTIDDLSHKADLSD